ncbi:TPA: hypothetical protein O8U20_004043 [Enterobacter cloacae]|nr:hypothetical protein [Enterobacter cloacae]
MSHPLNYYAIEEHARYIEQLSCGSHDFLKRINETQYLHEGEGVTEYELEEMEYKGWLEYTVSNNLIELCTKIRILQDTLDISWNEDYTPEGEAFERYDDIIFVLDGNVKPSIRECCNKVIHSSSFELEYEKMHSEYQYWNSCVILSGKQGTKKWKIKVNLFNFCLSIRFYLSVLRTA